MDFRQIMSSDSLQGQVARETIKILDRIAFYDVSNDALIIEQQLFAGSAIIMIDHEGNAITWAKQTIPPVSFTGKKQGSKPKQAKGNNAKQIVDNIIKQHEKNVQLLKTITS